MRAPRRHPARRRVRAVHSLALAGLLLASLAVASMTRSVDSAAPIAPPGRPSDGAPAQPILGPLRVATLNVAHGRRDAFNQLLLGRATFERNLDAIARLLRETKADVVALQEADGPSRWSGGFDHVARLAEEAGYPWHARASHATSWWFDYGTALLARAPLLGARSHAFRPTPPSLTKGFLLAQVAWQPVPADPAVRLVDLLSVHLDFSRRGVRSRQVAEIAEVLAGRVNPTIVLGDFNSDATGADSAVGQLATRCGLHAFRPEAVDLGTFRSSGRRLDWVLLSDELEFTTYRVVRRLVSDHDAVVAEIGLRGSGNEVATHPSAGAPRSPRRSP